MLRYLGYTYLAVGVMLAHVMWFSFVAGGVDSAVA